MPVVNKKDKVRERIDKIKRIMRSVLEKRLNQEPFPQQNEIEKIIKKIWSSSDAINK